VVLASDGATWFTDPHYGIMTDYEEFKAPSEQPCHVYRAVQGEPCTSYITAPALVTEERLANTEGNAFDPNNGYREAHATVWGKQNPPRVGDRPRGRASGPEF